MSEIAIRRPMIDVAELPDDPLARREALELRALPNPDRPVLSAEREARLAATEERSAQCYMRNEELTHRWHKFAERVRRYRNGYNE